MRDQLLLNLETQDVFTICLKRGEDVLIANPADPKLRPFIPEWLRGSLNQRTLMLLPLRNGEDIPGVICGIGKDEHSLERMSRFNEALKLMRTELMRVNLKRAA